MKSQGVSSIILAVYFQFSLDNFDINRWRFAYMLVPYLGVDLESEITTEFRNGNSEIRSWLVNQLKNLMESFMLKSNEDTLKRFPGIAFHTNHGSILEEIC